MSHDRPIDQTRMSKAVTRRGVARGAAWTAPVVALTSAAPAVAATPAPTYVIHGNTTINSTWRSTTDQDGRYRYKVYSSYVSAPPPAPGYCIENSLTTTTVTNVSVTYWFSSNSLTFTRNTTYDTAGLWTTLTRDTTKANKSYNRGTYYAYTSTYTGAFTPANGTACLATFAWESEQQQRSSTHYYSSSSATVNGAVQTLSYGPIRLDIA